MIVSGVDQQAAVQWAMDFWRRGKTEVNPKIDIWKECVLAYNSKFGKAYSEVSQYRSRRYLPLSYEAVENVSAHLIQGVMPHDQWFKYLGRTPDDDKAAECLTSLVKWQHFKTNWRAAFAEGMKAAAITGNVPWAILWRQDIYAEPDLQAHAANLGKFFADGLSGEQDPEAPPPEMPTQLRRHYDGPELVIGSIFDFILDRHGDDNFAPRAVRFIKSKEYLQEQAKPDMFGYRLYDNTENLTNASPIYEKSDAAKREIQVQMGIQDLPQQGVEIIEFHGNFPIGGQLYLNHVMTVANRSTLLRFEPNPFNHGKPIWNLFRLSVEPGEVYGKGVLEPALGLQDASNARMNQVIEANALSLSPMYVGVNDGFIDFDFLESAPGKVIIAASQGNLVPLQQPSNASLGMQEIGWLTSQFNEATNAMKAFTDANYQKSATEISAISGMTNSRFAEMIRHIESTWVTPALSMWCQLDQQLMDEATYVRVVQPVMNPPAMDEMGQPLPFSQYPTDRLVPIRISPDDIRGEFDVYPTGASWVANNQQKVMALIQYGQMAGANPMGQQSLIWPEYFRVVAEHMELPETYRFIKSEQRVQYEQYQQFIQRQQQLAAGSMQGGTAGQVPGPGGGPQSPGGGGGQGSADMAGAPGMAGPPPSPGANPGPGGPQTF